jgi:hypothetical protein
MSDAPSTIDAMKHIHTEIIATPPMPSPVTISLNGVFYDIDLSPSTAKSSLPRPLRTSSTHTRTPPSDKRKWSPPHAARQGRHTKVPPTPPTTVQK